MVKDIWPDDFYCPECKKSPPYSAIIGSRSYAAQRLDLPYFLCSDCRLCSYSKQLIKQVIQRWKKYSKAVVSDKQILKESVNELEKVMKHYTSRGCRLRRFKRNYTRSTSSQL